MKKILLLAAVVAGFNAIAQQAVVEGKGKLEKGDAFSTKTPTDTLTFDFLDNQVTYYNTGDYYLMGSNNPSSAYDIQGYLMDEDGYNVDGAFVWSAVKKDSIWSNDTLGSTIEFGLFNIDESSLMPILPPVQTKTVPYIETKGSLQFADGTFGILFDESYPMGFDYAIGMNFSNLSAGDTLAIVSTQHGFGSSFFYNWRVSPSTNAVTPFGELFTVGGQGLDINFIVLPIVDMSTVGIEEAGYFSGLKTEVYPNPASEQANITYVLENTGDVTLEVYSLTGQKLLVRDLGTRTAGVKFTETLSTSELAAGAYVYSIVSGENRIMSKLIIE